MSLTPSRLLEYFSNDDLKLALSIINESQSGLREELIERVINEWPAHNKSWNEIVSFLDKSTLSMICKDYGMEHTGTRNLLERRIRKELKSNSKSSKIQNVTKKSEGDVHYHIGSINISKGQKFGFVGIISIIIGLIGLYFLINPIDNMDSTIEQIENNEGIIIGSQNEFSIIVGNSSGVFMPINCQINNLAVNMCNVSAISKTLSFVCDRISQGVMFLLLRTK